MAAGIFPSIKWSYFFFRLESTASPLPSSSVSSVGTPESISSVDSPNSFSFAAPDSPSCDHPMRDVSKVDQNLA